MLYNEEPETEMLIRCEKPSRYCIMKNARQKCSFTVFMLNNLVKINNTFKGEKHLIVRMKRGLNHYYNEGNEDY